MSLEQDLRQTLHERAQTPAAQPDLLTAVRDGARRQNRRRATLLAGVAAVAVAAITLPLALTNGHRSTPDTAATPRPPSTAWHADWWVPPVFPMQPTWLPPDAKSRKVEQLGPNLVLKYEQGDSPLSVDIGPLEPEWEVEPADEVHNTTIGDQPAVVRLARRYHSPTDKFVEVRWKLPDGRTVDVLSLGRLTEQEVLRFAEGLQPGAIPADRPSIQVDAVPPGMVIQSATDKQVCFAQPQEVAKYRDGFGLCAFVLPGPLKPEPGDKKLTIGRRPAFIDGRGTPISIPISDRRILQISYEWDGVQFTRDDFLRFAEGVHVPK